MLLIVAAVGGIAVVDGECKRYSSESPSDPIENCCCLGYNYSTSFNKRRSVVYTLANFCGVKCLDIEGYCGSISEVVGGTEKKTIITTKEFTP